MAVNNSPLIPGYFATSAPSNVIANQNSLRTIGVAGANAWRRTSEEADRSTSLTRCASVLSGQKRSGTVVSQGKTVVSSNSLLASLSKTSLKASSTKAN